MKLLVHCLTCHSSGPPSETPISWSAIPDSGVLHFTCDKGHVSQLIISNERFELLSQLALKAITDGYYREAVASFTSALERAYEFYWTASGLRAGLELEKLDKIWKELRNSSERQLGAFITAWIRDHKEAPRLLRQKSVEIRNAVIHKGMFPSEKEAIEFGQEIADMITPLLKVLGDGFLTDEAIALKLIRKHPAHKAALKANIPTATTTQNTLFSAFSGHNSQPIDVAQAVATLRCAD